MYLFKRFLGRRQPFRIHVDNGHATDLRENRAVLGHDHGVHYKPIPESIWEWKIITSRLNRNSAQRYQDSSEAQNT
jgi:hypothetical protein